MTTSPLAKGILRQYMATISVSISFLMTGQSIAWPSPTLPKMMAYETPIYLDITQISWMVSLMFVGNIMSAIPAGYLMDKFGRKKSIVYANAIQFSTWILICIAQSATLVYISRFLAGIYFGLISTIEPVYIGEIAQPDIRGRLGTLNNLMMSIGMLITFIVGPYISYLALALFSTIPSLIFLLSFTFMPESPYFLVMKDNQELARKSLSWLRGDKNKIELEMELNLIEKTVQEQIENKGNYMDIFATKASRKAFIISEVFFSLRILSGFLVIQTYASTTLPELTFNFLNPGNCVIILGCIGVFSSFYTVFVTDKYGRKMLLIISCLGCGVTTLICGIWFYLDSKTEINLDTINFIPFVMYCIHAVTFSIGLGSVTTTIKGELFPTNVKANMSAITTITLAILAFILNKFYLIIAYEEGVYLNYFIFSISCAFGLIFAIIHLPETKGKTFIEIQDILNGIERQKITTPVLSRVI